MAQCTDIGTKPYCNKHPETCNCDIHNPIYVNINKITKTMKTPQEKQIEAYVETIAELNREVARLKEQIKIIKQIKK